MSIGFSALHKIGRFCGPLIFCKKVRFFLLFFVYRWAGAAGGWRNLCYQTRHSIGRSPIIGLLSSESDWAEPENSFFYPSPRCDCTAYSTFSKNEPTFSKPSFWRQNRIENARFCEWLHTLESRPCGNGKAFALRLRWMSISQRALCARGLAHALVTKSISYREKKSALKTAVLLAPETMSAEATIGGSRLRYQKTLQPQQDFAEIDRT